MEFETIFARIGKMRDALRAEFGLDSESTIAQIDRDLEAEIAKDPLLAYASNLFYKAAIAMRNQRIEVARKLQSNGVTENRRPLDLLLWDSRLIDFFVANLRPGEKLTGFTGFTLTTNQRVQTRDELKRACRQFSEMNDLAFERNFSSDQAVREAEVQQAQREQPISPGRAGVSNSDWPRR